MSDGATRRDDSGEPQATRRDPETTEPSRTAREGVGPDPLQRSLPSALTSRFRTLEELPAIGAEADLLLVESVADGTRCIAKIYRKGIAPKSDILRQIADAGLEHVVRLLEYGQSDGRWFELIEYIPSGSLRQLIDVEGPRVNAATVREVLRELADALAHLHARNIVHRDLKPENVLVRRREPLDLALTDFGIASVIEGSWRFSTNANRTVSYAAPEAWTGSVSPALDYWSLGMILAEMLIGKHPFAGASDAVVQRHLSTLPVPLESVAGDWRLLCLGLLTRNDRRRWGKAEVERWLAGDRTLTVPDDKDVSLSDIPHPPYRWRGEQYSDPATLARALAQRWEEAAKEVARGYIRSWVANDLRDLELTRFLDDLDEDRSLSLDDKLFRVITRFAPNSSPTYIGYALTPDSLYNLALGEVRAGEEQRGILAKVYDNRLLSVYTALTGKPELGALERRWREAMASFEALQRQAANSSLVRLPTVFVRAHLLLGLISPNYVENLRKEIAEKARTIGSDCPWFMRLGNPADAPAEAVVAMAVFAGAAGEEAQATRQRVREERAEARRVAREERRLRQAVLRESEPPRVFRRARYVRTAMPTGAA